MRDTALATTLLRHGVEPTGELLAELGRVADQLAEEAWLDRDQALALLPQLNGYNSLTQFLNKHRVRRRTSVQWTADVLRAVAVGDRRRSRPDD